VTLVRGTNGTGGQQFDFAACTSATVNGEFVGTALEPQHFTSL
jgi:hypothetical protein